MPVIVGRSRRWISSSWWLFSYVALQAATSYANAFLLPTHRATRTIHPNIQHAGEEERIPTLETLNTTALLDTNLLNQALSSQVSYFYLQKELGLSEESMWKITYDAPSALGMTAATIRAKVDVLKETMNLSPEDIREILSRQPSILHLSAENNLKPKLEWIQKSLEMNQEELRQLIVAQPSILTYAPSNLQNKLRFFTAHRGLGFTIAECRKLLLQEPRLWICSVKTGMSPRARFFLHELEISKENLRIILQKNPRLLLYSLEDNLAPKLINYAIMTLHMDPASHVTKLLTSYPQILDYNLERHIQPITQYFLTELEFSAHEFRSILLKCPRIMTYSLQRIKHGVGYLRYGLDLDAAGVKRILYQTPQVLGLDTEENLTPKIQFLQQQLLDNTTQVDSAEAMGVVRQVIVGMPTLLHLSVEKNLAPKFKYLRAMFQSQSFQDSDQATQQLLRQAILQKPALLGYSLETRIQPRMDQIVNAGLPASSITIGISMTEKKFQTWFQGRQKKKAKMAIVLQQQSPSAATSSSIHSSPKGALSDHFDDGRIVHWTRERRPTG